MAGRASSTTMIRFSVDVVSTTIAPSAACTRPSRKIPNHESGGGLFDITPQASERERGDQHAQDIEADAGPVVPRRAFARALQQPPHQHDLNGEHDDHGRSVK